MLTNIPSIEDKFLDCKIKQAIFEGRFSEARSMLNEMIQKNEELSQEYFNIISILDRVELDYKKTEESILSELRLDIPNIKREEIQNWLQDGSLEARFIDGELRYFNRAVINLFRLSSEAGARKTAFSGLGAASDPGDPASVSEKVFKMHDHMQRALTSAKARGAGWHEAVNITFKLKLTLCPKSLPKGELVRCWMPAPQLGAQHSNYKLISTKPASPVLSSPGTIHKSIYMEALSNGPGKDLVFSVEQSFDSAAFVSLVDPYIIKPYNTGSEKLEQYLTQEPPHVVFSSALRSLAAEICASEKNPYLKAKRIFAWISKNIIYTAAPEYSTIPAISEYCMARRRGDCGIQALLFIALCRVSGIPARWQSGWTLAPGKVNLHDWAMFYVEPYGWLHADPSRGLNDTGDEGIRWFYFGNIDSYRMVVNEGYGAGLEPEKRHLRSETVDFQIGEMEWKNGNLYFDEWDYDYSVEYVEV